MSLHYLVKHEWPKNQRNSPGSTKSNESQNSAVTYLILLRQDLLPEMRELSDFFTFQQDSAPAHRARPTVELLEKEVPDFISPSLWPLNSPVLNPVHYKICSLVQERVYQQPISNIDELRECIAAVWEKLSTIDAWTHPYASGESVFLLVWKPKGDILNICLNKSGLVVVLHKRHL